MMVCVMRRVGTGALLLECADVSEVEAWRAELWRRRGEGSLDVAEIVPGARTVLLDGLADPVAAARLIEGWAPPPAADAVEGAVVTIAVRYDGADLDDVAARWRMPVSSVTELLSSTALRVAFCGFAPGFAYLAGLPESLAVPRLGTPRPSVPAGSVGLAGEYVGIYPSASPGGWRLVGRTDAVLFDVSRDPPALLTPGARVRLEPA
jgi:KipI family sensor histidine kinase inhibitor